MTSLKQMSLLKWYFIFKLPHPKIMKKTWIGFIRVYFCMVALKVTLDPLPRMRVYPIGNLSELFIYVNIRKKLVGVTLFLLGI